VIIAVIPYRVSAALVGALVLAGTAVPVRAGDAPPRQLAHIAGVVVDASETTVQVRPPVGSPVTLTIANTTRIHIQLDSDGFTFPPKLGVASAREAPPASPPGNEPPNGAFEPDSAPAPSPLSFKGMYARAAYDRSNMVAAELSLTVPEPLYAVGRVDDPTTTGFSLYVGEGPKLPLVVKNDTRLFLDGRPVTLDKLAQGDRAEVLFLLVGDQNCALFVRARMAPPLTFGGLISQVGADSFSVAGAGEARQNFKVDSATAIRLNGSPATLLDLKQAMPVSVLYRARSGSNLALRVSAQKPKGQEPVKDPGKDKAKGGEPRTDPGKDKPKFEPVGKDSGKDKPKGQETRQDPDKDQPKGEQQGKEAGKDKPKGGEPEKGKPTTNGGDAGKGKPSAASGGSDKVKGGPNEERPRTFAGVVTAVGAAAGTFSARAGNSTLTFKVNGDTPIRRNDKPVALAELHVNDSVFVEYRTLADGNVALRVAILRAKAPQAEKGHSQSAKR
jgi:hypothetical protein